MVQLLLQVTIRGAQEVDFWLSFHVEAVHMEGVGGNGIYFALMVLVAVV
jgi:hypothetical protein